MAERSLKGRANGRMLQLQRACDSVGINNWKMKLQSTIPNMSRPGERIDMFIVRDGDRPETPISIGMGHGEVKAQMFFEKLFKGINPALAGSILLLDLHDALVKLEGNWEHPELRAEIKDKIQIIRTSVDRADRPVDPMAA
jgi:hypothetical protein